jgi:hypothetical protein
MEGEVPYLRSGIIGGPLFKGERERCGAVAVAMALPTRHQQLRKKGKPVTSLEETRRELEEALTEFRQSRFPIYQRLGLCGI